MDAFTSAYLEAAEWTECHSDNPELAAADGWSSAALADAERDCGEFQNANDGLLEIAYDTCGYGAGSAGHDFWLTRNRHGAGFWDRGLGRVGDVLTRKAHEYGGADVYVGDDGDLYFA